LKKALSLSKVCFKVLGDDPMKKKVRTAELIRRNVGMVGEGMILDSCFSLGRTKSKGGKGHHCYYFCPHSRW
jgi:hypothetical protein